MDVCEVCGHTLQTSVTRPHAHPRSLHCHLHQRRRVCGPHQPPAGPGGRQAGARHPCQPRCLPGAKHKQDRASHALAGGHHRASPRESERPHQVRPSKAADGRERVEEGIRRSCVRVCEGRGRGESENERERERKRDPACPACALLATTPNHLQRHSLQARLLIRLRRRRHRPLRQQGWPRPRQARSGRRRLGGLQTQRTTGRASRRTTTACRPCAGSPSQRG